MKCYGVCICEFTYTRCWSKIFLNIDSIFTTQDFTFSNNDRSVISVLWYILSGYILKLIGLYEMEFDDNFDVIYTMLGYMLYYKSSKCQCFKCYMYNGYILYNDSLNICILYLLSVFTRSVPINWAKSQLQQWSFLTITRFPLPT